MARHLFVYGTLLGPLGQPMSQRLRRLAEFIGQGSIAASLYQVGWYPGAVPDSRTGERVHGEVYLLRQPQRLLEELDRYEGCLPRRVGAGPFRRDTTIVSLSSGGRLAAWVYWYERCVTRLERIESGDYLAAINR
jgi:gamma-glutamylcyclotransferase (GGCT)/AIG2-like uncharacterized protein YtfP